MPHYITYFLVLFIALYLLTLVLQLKQVRAFKRVLWEVLLLIVLVAILNITTGFPIPSARQAFGGTSPLITIGIMFLCTILGMIGHYFFFLKSKFSWMNFLKPFFVSPIILLPLIGSVQGTASLEPMQLISFSFLAFQNGFFWKVVFENVQNRQ